MLMTRCCILRYHCIVALYRVVTPTVRHQGKPTWFPIWKHQVTCDLKVSSSYPKLFWNYLEKAIQISTRFQIPLHTSTDTGSWLQQSDTQGKPAWFPIWKHQVTCDLKVSSSYPKWFWNYLEKAIQISTWFQIPLHTSFVQGRDSNSQTPRKTNLISKLETSGYMWSEGFQAPTPNGFGIILKKLSKFPPDFRYHCILALYRVVTPTVRHTRKTNLISNLETSGYMWSEGFKLLPPNGFGIILKKLSKFPPDFRYHCILALYRVVTPTVRHQGTQTEKSGGGNRLGTIAQVARPLGGVTTMT